jgi:MYXO-CTERM domain-containing protein
VWDESQQLFVVGITDPSYGIWLSRLDPLAPVPGAIQRIAAGPLSGNGDNVGLELAASPDGTIAAAWRTDGTIAALVMPPGASGFDGGTVLTTTASGPPSITWTGSRFRVLAPVGPLLTVHELFLAGGVAALDTLNSSGSIRPLAVTEGPLVVYASGSSADRFGADLFFQQRQEGVLDPSATLFTYSGRASHSPVAAWKSATNAMVAYSTSDDGGVQQHDIAYRLFNPPSTFAPPAYLGGATRDDAFPRITDSLGNWWIGAYAPSTAKVFSAPDGTTTFREVFSFNSNGPPDLESGWLAFARDGDAMDFRRLLGDGGVGPTASDVILLAPWFPDLAVDAQGRPAATSVKRPGATEGIIFSPQPNGLALSLLANAGGEPRAASLASDGTRFSAVYTTRAGAVMTVERRDLAYDDAGVVNLLGAPVELTRAPLIETPFIAYANGQYLVTWSERDDIVQPSKLKLMTLKTDGGTGAVVPLELGSVGNDGAARLAVSPNEKSAFLTWTRLDAADSGVPTGFIATISIGAPVSAVCAAGSECTTGFCADQVCCETACNEGCGTCSASGRCEPLPLGTSCQPLGECMVATAGGCDSVSVVCPSMPGNEGTSCDSGAGTCQQGVCVPLGVPDGGGAPDAGPPEEDAGTPDAGGDEPDAGPSSPDGGADGGREDDGGVPMGVAPRSNFSHYSWAQGCGCSTGSDAMSVIALALLFLTRIRRARGVVLSAVVVAAVLVAQPAKAEQPKLKLSFPGVAAGAGAKAEDANAIGEFAQTQLVALGIYEVTGSSDLAAMLGMERQKELLGCDVTCAVDIAGALDADRLLTSSLSKVGETWLLTMSLYDARKNQPLFRASRRFTGSLEKALDQIDPMLAELIEHDPVAQATKPAVAPAGTNQWAIGLRAELEAMGIIDGQPAIAPAVFASWGRGIFGAAVTVIVLPTIGVRAEGRLHLLEASRIRPLFGIGASLFGTAFAPRGMLGVTADIGPVRLSLDAAIEYYVSGESRFEPLAILTSFGAAWRF